MIKIEIFTLLFFQHIKKNVKNLIDEKKTRKKNQNNEQFLFLFFFSLE